MARETNNDLTNYIASCKRLRLARSPSMDLPPLPYQCTTSLDDPDQLRFLQSQSVSTTAAVPIVHDHLFYYFHLSDMELNANHDLCLQNEKLVAGLEETWKRRYRGLILAIKQQVIRRLIEKESELEIAKQRSSQLEERLTQINAEIYVWFDAAKNSEAVAATLQTKLDQAISTVGEGSDGCNGYELEDAQSCCVEVSKDLADVARRWWRICGGFGGKEARVLLLPCRHLCLCKDCEPMTATCPLCCSVKNASLEISISQGWPEKLR